MLKLLKWHMNIEEKCPSEDAWAKIAEIKKMNSRGMNN